MYLVDYLFIFYSFGFLCLCLCLSLSLASCRFVAVSLAACGAPWPGVARNTGAVIWTAGRSISKGPRRCKIWDTFHSTLPSFWQKERDSAAQPKKQNRRKAIIYTKLKILLFLQRKKEKFNCANCVQSLISSHWLTFVIDLRMKGKYLSFWHANYRSGASSTWDASIDTNLLQMTSIKNQS